MKILAALSSFGLTTDNADDFVATALCAFLSESPQALGWEAYADACWSLRLAMMNIVLGYGPVVRFIRPATEGLVLIGGC